MGGRWGRFMVYLRVAIENRVSRNKAFGDFDSIIENEYFMKTRKEQITDLIEKVINYEAELDRILFDKHERYIKSYKEFLIEAKIKELISEFLDEKEIQVIVFEESNGFLENNQLLLEWEQYKNIPKTNLTYRYDKGKGIPGSQDHLHVFVGKTKNQVYAINKDGTPHDGSMAKIGKKEVNFLKSLGFTPPENGILEWMDLDPKKNYSAYRVELLFS